MDEIIKQGTVILMGIIGIAILAVILSKNSNTTNVLGSFFTGFSRSLNAAEAPIVGPSTGFSGLGGYTSNAITIPSFAGNYGG